MVSITTTQLCHCSVKEARDNLSLGLTTADYKTGLAVACPGVEELGTGKTETTSSLQILYQETSSLILAPPKYSSPCT